jgi:hypothetical protein
VLCLRYIVGILAVALIVNFPVCVTASDGNDVEGFEIAMRACLLTIPPDYTRHMVGNDVTFYMSETGGVSRVISVRKVGAYDYSQPDVERLDSIAIGELHVDWYRISIDSIVDDFVAVSDGVTEVIFRDESWDLVVELTSSCKPSSFGK